MNMLNMKNPHSNIVASLSLLLCFLNGANAFAPVQKLSVQSFMPTTSNSVPFSGIGVDLNSSPSTSNEEDADCFSHNDVTWKIKPWIKNKNAKNNFISIISSTVIEKSVLKVASNLIRLDCKINNKTPPKVLCPKSGQAVLEAYVKRQNGLMALLPFKKKVARFGITTHRGPPAPQISTTIEQVYNITLNVEPGVAAIIYMFVEPEYRSTGLGELALEVISSIHAFQRCDFTILVADDDGSGKLVEWYGTNGFEKAPLLQEMMGSPDGKFGTTMIRPTSISQSFYDDCKIKWW